MPTVFRLAAALEKAGISQAELSRRSGVSIQTVNRLVLNRTAQVALATLDRLAQALGVEPGQLLEREARRRK